MLFDETLGIPTYLSLCSGYDGIGLGLKRVIPNLRTIAHVEIEAYAIANLISKMEAGQLDACPVFSDLKQFPFEQVRGRVGILSAGFPCQPFSSAGRRQSTEDPRHIYPFIADGISICRPRYVFLENVRGIVSAKTADGESVLKYVLGDLESRGYETEWGLFSAEETGAPHQRIRCFILAYRDCEGSQGMLQDFGSQGRETEGRSTARCGEHSSEQFPNSGNAKGYSTIEGCIRQSLGNPTGERPRGGSENCKGEQSEVLGERLESDEWQQVSFSADCLGGDEDELGYECSICGQDYSECGCPGPTQDGYEYKEINGEMYARKELANPASREPRQSQARNGGQDTGGGSEDTRWPARPGEEQYEWEEPRVTEAQSELGGAVARTQHRVDRLRLLGNGVVPQTAELAWKTLWKKMNK